MNEKDYSKLIVSKDVLKNRALFFAKQITNKGDQKWFKGVHFKMGDEHYIIKLEDLKEVVPFEPLSKPPSDAQNILGYITTRGEIRLVLDLQYLLTKKSSLSSTDKEDKEKTIIFWNLQDNEVCGFLVSKVLGVYLCDQNLAQYSIPTLQGLAQEYVQGIFEEKIDGQVVPLIWLNVRKLQSELDKSLKV
ncbi:MAG: chemotaxis protein CheW [Bacteriovoracaceae bacterium]|nr:chemotaxis protein CheW [Bacteriovoracaceae bacterium]